jgi:SAM-dependent methyltransferase
MKRYYFLPTLIFLLIVSCSQQEESNNENSEQLDSNQKSLQAESKVDVAAAEVDLGRTEWQNPELVLSSIGDLEGKVIADLGAGSGYFTFKMAQKAQKIIALDIDPKALEYIDNQIEIAGDWANNIETRLTPAERPNLEINETDAVLIVNTYFYIPERQSYLQQLSNCIKENGKLVIVEYKIGDMIVGPSDDFKVTPEAIETELRKSGFKSVNVDLQSLQYQFVITAEKR